MRGSCRKLGAEWIAVPVCIVGEQIAGEGRDGVRSHHIAVIVGHGSIINVQRHGRDVAAQQPVVRHIGETVRAVEAAGRLVLERAVVVVQDERSVRRARVHPRGQRSPVGIRVVCEHARRNARTVIRRDDVAVVRRYRRVVDGQRHGHRLAVQEPVIRHIGEAVRAAEARVRLVDE